MFDSIGKATVQIICGNCSGSGFHFVREDLIITNHHVIENHVNSNQSVYALTDSGEKIDIKLIEYSDKDTYDFAVFEVTSDIPSDRYVLHPNSNHNLSVGTKIIFSGFPHGISDLLAHQAIISGYPNDKGFYIDGSVNGGNSGGPIVDKENQNVIGIVTQRRFLGASNLQNISSQIEQVSRYCHQISNRGSVFISGIDFGQFAQLMADSLLIRLLRQMQIQV